jgi:hypothetical protein
MGNGDSISESLKTIFSYNIVSLMFIFAVLFAYGVGKDFILFRIYELALTLQSQGLFGSWVADFISSTSNVLDIFPQYLDLLWFLLTVTLFIELVIASYYAEREGWFSTLGFMTFGILFFLFMMGIFSEIGDWFQTNFINNLFSGISYSTPFLNFYLNNLLIINLIIVIMCIIANFIDLDIQGFDRRKSNEISNDEVV